MFVFSPPESMVTYFQVSKTWRIDFSEIFIKKKYGFIKENMVKNVICKMVVILSQHEWVNGIYCAYAVYLGYGTWAAVYRHPWFNWPK